MADVELTAPFPAYNGTGPYVFVSYAHADGDKVFPEIAFLHAQGYRIWYDEGIDPGNEWPDEIARALQAASYFLVFISPRAVASSNVRNEINVALNKRKPFMAIHLVETELTPGLELRMGDIQALMRFRMGTESYREKLLKVLPLSLKDEALAGSSSAAEIGASGAAGSGAAIAPPTVAQPANASRIDPETYTKSIGLSVVDSAGARTLLKEYGIVYRPFGGNTMSNAFTEGFILEKGTAAQTIPWSSIRRIVVQGKDSATVELRDGRSMGPVKPRSGYLVGTDDFGFEFSVSLADAETISFVMEADGSEWNALLRDIPELVRKTTSPGGYQATFKLVPQEHGVLVTLDHYFDGELKASQTFEMPGQYDFRASRSDWGGWNVAVHAKEYYNLNGYEAETATSLAKALTRLNELSSKR
jgi:hypothetical protein